MWCNANVCGVLVMSQQQPQLYNNLTAALGPEEQQVIKAALDQADKIANDAQQAQANAQGQGQGQANARLAGQTNGT